MGGRSLEEEEGAAVIAGTTSAVSWRQLSLPDHFALQRVQLLVAAASGEPPGSSCGGTGLAQHVQRRVCFCRLIAMARPLRQMASVIDPACKWGGANSSGRRPPRSHGSVALPHSSPHTALSSADDCTLRHQPGSATTPLLVTMSAIVAIVRRGRLDDKSVDREHQALRGSG